MFSSSLRTLLTLAFALPVVGCLGPSEVPMMGAARITSDFDTYAIHRVGMVPFQALDEAELAPHEIGLVETAFHSEFVAGTSYDIVSLRGLDLDEVLPPNPFREGSYSPQTIRTIRDRYQLDAIMVGTITSRRVIAPQVLGVQMDLVSCETGATIWSSDLLLDAARQDTRDALDIWAQHELGDEHGAQMALISPLKFAQFAAYQVARLL